MTANDQHLIGKRTQLVIFLTFAVALALQFWIVPLVLSPDKSPDGLVMFRAGGDPDYLPLVAADAHLNLGEITIKEYAGSGLRAFPHMPVLVHAVLYRLAGSTGFILADVLFVVLYACLLRWFLCMAEVDSASASILSLAVIFGATGIFWNSTSKLLLYESQLFWDFRFPRASVTEVVFILFLISAVMVLMYSERLAAMVAVGVCFAAVLQSDIYEAFIAFGITAMVYMIALWRSKNRGKTVVRLLIAGATAAVACLPFVFQQLHSSAEIKSRWGVFPIHRFMALAPPLSLAALTLVIVGVSLAVVKPWKCFDLAAGKHATLLVAASSAVASLITGPASVAVLHQAIQIYHFKWTSYHMLGYLLLPTIGWWATDLKTNRIAQGKWPAWTEVAAPILGAAIFAGGFCLSLRRGFADIPTAPYMRSPYTQSLALTHYRTDFRELHVVLDSPEYAYADVLGTLDIQLANWWQYKGHHLYLVDAFNSRMPDSMMEARVLQLLHILGASDNEFKQFLESQYFLGRFMFSLKYQANSLYTPRPLNEYSPSAQAEIVLSKPEWNIELPEVEKNLLVSAYNQPGTMQNPMGTLDIIVLDKDAYRSLLHPEKNPNLRLAWSDRSFELWVYTGSNSALSAGADH